MDLEASRRVGDSPVLALWLHVVLGGVVVGVARVTAGVT
jgi:hypothetical protein